MKPSDFSMYGAVDLGARKAALERQARSRQGTEAAQSPGQEGAGAAIIDVTEETFVTEVVQRSATVPVIIDFWAEWCQPCKQLSPILERLASQADGRWVLAKIDIDANERLAAAMRVQSIPTVLAVFGGQPISGFQGALPEPQVRQWLDQIFDALREYLPADGGETADPAANTAQLDPGYAEAEQAIERGDADAAAAAYRKILNNNPADPGAKLGLARTEIVRRTEGVDVAKARRDAADRPDDVAAQCLVADFDVIEGRVEEALDRLLGTIRRAGGEDRDRARQHLLSLFDALPGDDPRVASARRTLARLLF